MVYVRAGTVSEEPGIVTKVLDLPYRIYQFLMFFVMTLIDVRTHARTPLFFIAAAPRSQFTHALPFSSWQPSAARKASQMANKSRGNVRKLGGMKNIGGGGGGCGPVGG